MTNIDLSRLELCSCKKHRACARGKFWSATRKLPLKGSRENFGNNHCHANYAKKNRNKTVIHSCIRCFESSFRFLNLLIFSTNQLIVRILSINWSREFVTIVTNSNFNCLLVAFVLRKICMRAFSHHLSRHLFMLFLSRNFWYSLVLI